MDPQTYLLSGLGQFFHFGHGALFLRLQGHALAVYLSNTLVEYAFVLAEGFLWCLVTEKAHYFKLVIVRLRRFASRLFSLRYVLLSVSVSRPSPLLYNNTQGQALVSWSSFPIVLQLTNQDQVMRKSSK